jgi:PelA/Pel-15E family pectate lyase
VKEMANMPRHSPVALTLLLCFPASCLSDEPLTAQAGEALRRAVEFFSKKVSSHGGYVYRYSADLAKREGEGKVGPDTVWVQPPGTPAVGLAYLEAYERTGQSYLLEAAKAAGECLIRGQLRSGGWNASIEFDPQARSRWAYRVDPPRRRARNHTSFDDDKTQSALRFLMRLDQALNPRDERVHEAAGFALDSIIKAQFPNGAWPQGYDQFPDPAKHPVRPASFPQSWPRKHPGGDYWNHYTLNDNAIADTIDTLILAARLYREPRYRSAALRAGDFLILAQLPEPQPAWAQQYDNEMHPVWARKFEPPAISGGESQGVMEALLRLYVESGERRFLKPIGPALEYLRRSLLSDGRLARFYELRTNRPLYLTRDYELTYNDGELPTHYAFKVASRIDRIQRQYDRLAKLSTAELTAFRDRADSRSGDAKPLEGSVGRIIKSLDDRGAWVEPGSLRYHGASDDSRQVIDTRTFIRNIEVLSQYLKR